MRPDVQGGRAASPARLRLNKCLAKVQPRSEVDWLGTIPEGCRKLQVRTLPPLLCDASFGLAGSVLVDGKDHATFLWEGNPANKPNERGACVNINIPKEFVGRELRVKLAPKQDSPFGLYMMVD